MDTSTMNGILVRLNTSRAVVGMNGVNSTRGRHGYVTLRMDVRITDR